VNQGHPLRANARILAAALVGTSVEYYDFFIYGTAAALVFGPLFFPSESEAAQTMLAFMSFGIAFFARPIGAIAFGHFGDRVGRKSTLVVSLLLMGGCTLAIAFLPTYAMIGWMAPTLLCMMRFGQGLGLGGEWGGAALLVVENAPKGWETRFASIMQLGAPIGFIAANSIFLLLGLSLSEADFVAWGWRIPFLASALLVVVGLWVRLKINETPAFRDALAKEAPPALPLARVFADHAKAVATGSAGVVATFGLFYLSTSYALAQATGPLGYDREAFLAAQLGASIVYVLAIILSGIYADRTSPALTIGYAAIATIGVGLIFAPGLGAGSLAVAAGTLCAAMFVLGLVSGPLGAWLSSLFPVPVRYSGVSLSYNIGGIIGGALSPIAAQWMSAEGLAHYVGLLLIAAGAITYAGTKLAKAAHT
jgi:MFS family permease